MNRRNDEAFVLGTHPLGEADLIVTLFGRRSGKVRGVAKGARRSRRRFGGCLEPLSWVRARWLEKEGRDLHRLEELELVRSFAPMQSEPLTQAMCAVFAEVTSAVTREEHADDDLFRLIPSLLGAVESGIDPTTALRYFEFWCLKLQGMLPDLDACAGCGAALAAKRACWIDPDRGPVCASCRASAREIRRLSSRGREFLAAASRRSPESMAEYRGHASEEALERLLRGMLESFIERRLRTYRHFHAAAS